MSEHNTIEALSWSLLHRKRYSEEVVEVATVEQLKRIADALEKIAGGGEHAHVGSAHRRYDIFRDGFTPDGY